MTDDQMVEPLVAGLDDRWAALSEIRWVDWTACLLVDKKADQRDVWKVVNLAAMLDPVKAALWAVVTVENLAVGKADHLVDVTVALKAFLMVGWTVVCSAAWTAVKTAEKMVVRTAEQWARWRAARLGKCWVAQKVARTADKKAAMWADEKDCH